MEFTDDGIFPLQMNEEGLLTVNASQETAGVVSHTTIKKCIRKYIFRHTHTLFHTDTFKIMKTAN